MFQVTLRGLLFAGVVVGVSGCKGGGDELAKAQEKFAEEACACKDLACVKKIQEKQAAWVTEHGQAAVGDEETAQKVEAANKKLTECVTKIVQAAAGG